MDETILDYMIRAGMRRIIAGAGSLTAAKVAGTYAFAYGDTLAVSGTGTAYPLVTCQILSSMFPPATGLTPKMYLQAEIFTNDVAPTGNYTIGLHPITRPATSGGSGVCIYTIGAAVVGSTVTFTTPAADAMLSSASSMFSLPADGIYVLGCVTTSTVANSAHIHLNARVLVKDV